MTPPSLPQQGRLPGWAGWRDRSTAPWTSRDISLDQMPSRQPGWPASPCSATKFLFLSVCVWGGSPQGCLGVGAQAVFLWPQNSRLWTGKVPWVGIWWKRLVQMLEEGGRGAGGGGEAGRQRGPPSSCPALTVCCSAHLCPRPALNTLVLPLLPPSFAWVSQPGVPLPFLPLLGFSR